MATRVDLNADQLKSAIQKSIDSLKRAIAGTTNSQIKTIYDQELQQLQKAQNTLTEIK